MSAPFARPPPPPSGPYPYSYTNGAGGYNMASNSISGPASPPRQIRGEPRTMLHIKDLQTRAELKVREMDRNITMGHLLSVAEQSTKAAEYLLEYRRPDHAYVEYLCAMDIVTRVIPRHKDAVLLHQDRGSMHRLNKDLTKKLFGMSDRFDKVKEIIQNDNRRNQVEPIYVPQTASQAVQRPSTSVDLRRDDLSRPQSQMSLTNGHATPAPRPSSYIESESGVTFLRSATPESGTSGRSTPEIPASLRPAVRPKPPNLHSAAVNGAYAGRSTGVDPLTERFGKLRASNDINSNGHNSRPSMGSSIGSQGPLPPPPEHREGLSRINAGSLTTSAVQNGSVGLPPRPSKLPLDTHFASAALPKAPSPTYSPARNMMTPSGVNPPKSTARSIVGTGGRSNSIISSASSVPPGTNGSTDSYFPDTMNGSKQNISRRKSVNIARESQISVEKLYDYLRLYNVLLIDLRPRDDFDVGHIYTRSIMCIEPTALRGGMSADQIQEGLVLAPDIEQTMFEKRDQFDLVVYYDQSTRSTSFLGGTPRNEQEKVLKDLYDSLVEFNGDKPLQRPPIFLAGGIEAWADLLGQSALATSNTSTTKKVKAARPIQRRPPAGANSQLYIRKRRMRDYNPLDDEEERKWAERARTESIALQGSLEETVENDDLEEVPIYRTTEDFLRRYPDVSPIERQSMTSPQMPGPPPVPSYPIERIPNVPSRPAPAAPKPAYRGAHEQQQSAYTANSRGPQPAPYIPPNEMPTNIRLPRTGLINFGATCYMNSTIQCLNATLPLTRMFRSGTFRKYLQRENWKGSKGILPEHYSNLVLNLWKGDVGACRPSTFRNFCARLNREWGSDRQQDAKEFFDFLIDFLHEDLNWNWNNPPPHVLSALEEQLRERTPRPFASRVEWLRYTKRERSIISDLFAGQHASRLKCTTCGTTSTTYEAFYSISVEIPRSGTATIEQCLRSYCSEEMLSGDEVWKCPSCKKEREATKQITITRAPRYLVVHFKRFSASHNESARKVRTPIHFPLNGLNLEPFMLSPPSNEEVAQAIRDRGIESIKNDCALDEPMTPPYRYSAYAVMRHIGSTLHSGHYVAMVKDPGRSCWRAFNDERVTDFDPQQLAPARSLQNEEAYIVFFERDFSDFAR